jgi:hypothetical protein
MESFHPSWSPAARDLVLRAIDRHGGWALWNRLESVAVSLVRLSGLLPWLKGYQRSYQLPRTMTSFPGQERSELGEQGRAWVSYQRGDVRLGESGEVSRHHRRTFAGLRKLRRWSLADAGYFFGYAFATYTAVPFTLPGLVFVRSVRGTWRGEKLEGVRVAFPDGADVHSPRQNFLFDRTGLLRRMDYVADVAGWWARGAHGCDEYATAGGLPFPLQRTVVLRLGMTPIYPLVALSARFDDLQVKNAASPRDARGTPDPSNPGGDAHPEGFVPAFHE